MENKYKLLALIAAVLAVIIIAVVIVGLVNGTWPWEGKGWFSGDYHGMPGKPTTESTTQSDTTGDPTGTTTQDPTGTTGGNSGSGSTGNQGDPVQKEPGDITIDIGNLSGGSGTTKPDESTGTTEGNKNQGDPVQKEEGDIFIPIGGSDSTTEAGGNTPNPPSKNGSISFSDLLEAMK